MSAAGERVYKLWVEATPETIVAACDEAARLAPQLEEHERDYLEGLAMARDAMARNRPDSPPAA